MITGEYDIISYLRAVENWMSASSIHYRHDIKDRIHTYVILHEMGKKWSYFFEKWFKGAVTKFFCNLMQNFCSCVIVLLPFCKGIPDK
jgi:hypothetical protein